MIKLFSFLRGFRRRRFIVLLVILLVIGSITLIQLRNQPQTLQTTEVKKQDIKSMVSASGTLTGKETVNLRFKSTGKLGYLNVKVGNKIEAGQVIAGLDTEDLSITLQQTQNTLKDKEAALEKIIDDIHLFQYGNQGTSGETETQRSARTSAEVARDNAYDSVRAAQRAFQDAVIVSPISGLVTKADPVPGQIVAGSDTIASVSDTSEIYFEAEVDEADISKVSLSQKTEVSLDAYPDQKFSGTVVEILPTTKSTSSGATVVIARINLGNPSINFIAGLNGQAEIIQSEKKNVLTIPQDALREDDTVLIADQGFRPKKVMVGITSDTDVEVLEGLKEGEKVVLDPPTNIPGRQSVFGGVFRFLGGGRGR